MSSSINRTRNPGTRYHDLPDLLMPRNEKRYILNLKSRWRPRISHISCPDSFTQAGMIQELSYNLAWINLRFQGNNLNPAYPFFDFFSVKY